LLAAGLLLSAALPARCDTETWDPGGAGSGDGTWDDGITPNWNSGAVWTNSNDALFSGAGGVITVADPTVDSLTFSASGPYLIESGTLNFTGGNVTVNSDATISSTIIAENGLYTMGSGALTLTGSVNLESAGLTVDLGTVNITSGGYLSDSIGTISDNAGAGAVTVSGPGSTWTTSAYLYVGETGPGTLQITDGGALSVPGGYYDYTYIAANPGSSGVVTVSGSGSTWTNSGYISVGTAATGAVTITGGGVVSNDHDAYIGDGYGGAGTATVSGSGSSWTVGGFLVVGNQGTGTLLIENGGNVSGSYIGLIGEQPGSAGTVTVSGTGSALSLASGLYVGGDEAAGPGSTGLLVITGGGSVSAPQTTVQPASTLVLGQNPVLDSPLDLAGGALSLVDGRLHTVTLTQPVEIDAASTLSFGVGNGADQIAFSGDGSLSVTGPGTVDLYGLSGHVTPGTYVLIGAATSGNLSIGNVYNTGNFTYSLLSTSTAEELVVTPAAAPLTTAYWQGGQNNLWSILVGGASTNWTTDAAGASDPGLTPSATTDVILSGSSQANDGDMVLGTDMTIKSLTVGDPNAVTISGANPNPWLANNRLTISGSTGTTGITVTSGAGLVTISANVYLSGGSQTVTVNNPAGLLLSGSIGSSGGLTKSGTGALTVSGIGTYAGPTTINSGTMILSGSLSGTASVSVNDATVDLAAPGAINSAARITLSNGVLNAQNNPLRAADLTTTGASTLDLGVDSNAAILTFAASNSDAWTGTLTIEDWNGYQDGNGPDQVSFGASSSGLTAGQLADIQFLNPTVNGVAQEGDFSAVILSDGEIVAAVPEPPPWGTIGSGFAMLLVIRRWRGRRFEP
jgi:T5SS/PEP-CTERM-associated repeat protein/autotransporter-associated beta strand protein